MSGRDGARDCLASDALCRLSEGYERDFGATVEGSLRFVCVPEP